MEHDPEELYQETDRDTTVSWLEAVEENIAVGESRGGSRFSDREKEFIQTSVREAARVAAFPLRSIMNKREELLSEYNIQDSHITSPGKFQGERVYVPYFWEKGLEGWADFETNEDDPGFVVMPEDIQLFPELLGVKTVVLHEDSNGFVREVPVDNSVESY